MSNLTTHSLKIEGLTTLPYLIFFLLCNSFCLQAQDENNILMTEVPEFQVAGFTLCNQTTLETFGYVDHFKIRFADMNGDSLVDGIIGVGSGSVMLLINEGPADNPCFTLSSSNLLNYDVGQRASPEPIDADLDGDYDLVVGGGYDGCGGTLLYFENTGDIFQYEFNTLPVPLTYEPQPDSTVNINNCDNNTPTFFDYNNDGAPDRLYLGGGYGNIQVFKITYQQPNSFPVFELITTDFQDLDTPSRWKSTIFLKDIIDDSKPEYFISYINGAGTEILAFKDISTSSDTIILESFDLPTLSTINASWPFVTLEDINNDGICDLFLSMKTGITFLINNGSPGVPFFEKTTEEFPEFGVTNARHLTISLLNNNMHPDFLIGTVEGTLVWVELVINPAGQHTLHYKADPIPNIQVDEHAAATTFDYDGDGLIDIIVGDKEGNITLFLQETDSVGGSVFTQTSSSLDDINIGLGVKPFIFMNSSTQMPELYIGQSNSIWHYTSLGTPSNYTWNFQTNNFQNINANGINTISFYDFSNDGIEDLLINANSQLKTFINSGQSNDPDYYFEPYVNLPNQYGSRAIDVFDLDQLCNEDIGQIKTNAALELWTWQGISPEILYPEATDVYCQYDIIQAVALPDGGFFSGGANPDGTIVTDYAPDNVEFIYTYEDYYGCSLNDTGSIFITLATPVIIEPIEAICENGSPVQLTPNQPLSDITWFGVADEDGIIDPSLFTPGVYYAGVEFLDNNQCTSFDSISIEILPIPEITLLSNEDSFCVESGSYTFEIQSNFPGVWSGDIDETGTIFPSQLEIGDYTATYTAFSSDNCSNSYNIDFSVTECTTGIEDFLSKKLRVDIYPNPSERLTNILVSSSEYLKNISTSIFDATGRCILKSMPKPSNTNNSANFIWDGTNESGEPMPRGIYFVELKTEHHTFYKKIIRH